VTTSFFPSPHNREEGEEGEGEEEEEEKAARSQNFLPNLRRKGGGELTSNLSMWQSVDHLPVYLLEQQFALPPFMFSSMKPISSFTF